MYHPDKELANDTQDSLGGNSKTVMIARVSPADTNAELQRELQDRRVTCESLAQRACDAHVEKDRRVMKIESIRNGKSWDEIESNSHEDYDLVKSYVSKIQDLKGELQRMKKMIKEIEEHRCNLANISSTSDDGAQKLKEEYLQKLNALEAQVLNYLGCLNSEWPLPVVSVLKKEQGDKNRRVMRQLNNCRMRFTKLNLIRYDDHLRRLCTQFVQLQRKIKQESEQFRLWKVSREKEALMQTIEHELEVAVRVHEVRSAYEQSNGRAKMANEIARLKEEADMMKMNSSSGAEKMINSSSTPLLSMASQLLEAEERERVFSGKGRWNQVRSLAEAKNVMNHLFNLACSSR
ncbi:hypothetical protein V8G54_022359 [Vigna mungo]|uniref:Uncharacterized protein n=1 Tax=Vigna mungo TaxID=3915 RepID=A0AAQ3NHV2_VIGMU